jgi:hypothetical protein
MNKTGLWLVPALLGCVVPALAQGAANITQESVEITPFGGIRTGGGLTGELDGTARDFSIESGAAYGGTVDVNLHKGNFKLELLYSHQGTQLETAGLLPGGARLNVDVLQAGILQETGRPKSRFFVSFLLGATRFDPKPYDSLTKFSLSIGGGLKAFLSSHVGLRFEGRAYLTFVETDAGAFCANGTCLFSFGGSNMWQGEFTGGLILAF